MAIKLDFSRSTLLIIDVQNDFCPSGVLEVKNGDEVIGPLNRLASLFIANAGRVVATQDWHPIDHVSFASSHANKKPGETVDLPGVKGQILWPSHCVQRTTGAEFHADLNTGPISLIVRKGFHTGLDSYSAFFENDRKTTTGLDGFLKSLAIDTLVLGGLALNYCVLYSGLDAVRLGYKTIVAADAVRAVDFPKGSVDKARKLLDEAGVIMAESGEIQ